MDTPRRTARAEALASTAITLVILNSILAVFLPHAPLGYVSAAALAVYFALCWRHLSGAAWMTLGLATALLAAELIHGVRPGAVIEGMNRMGFLAAFLAVMSMLRTAASSDPEIIRAGDYLTGQPPGRRYIAMTFGGQFLGMLVNFGGLAILLEMTRRAIGSQRGKVPDTTLDWRLRRMSTATLRGFSLLPLWSQIGIGINALLLAMPDLRYADLVGGGLAGCALFIAWGLLLDHFSSPRPQPSIPSQAPATPRPLFTLAAHIVLLVIAIATVGAATGTSFQSAQLLAVPFYSVFWAVWSLRQTTPPGTAAKLLLTSSFAGFSRAAAEIGVFASAGLLSVLILEVLPADLIEQGLRHLGQPWMIVVLLNATLFLLALIGVNPIVSASVMATMIGRFDISGLPDVPVALGLAGAWAAVMGFAPAMTTVTFSASIIHRRAWTVGPLWNGPFCISVLSLWTTAVSIWVAIYG
ncbi:hypothetical protein [Salipiger bermudensis]|uniref:hypothetical protein n=1 Tax=Salipiger bermudensis TaxID=344736 RepID=UPI0035147F10